MDDCQQNLAADCANLVLPATLPVMVLSECWLFPGCLLPLFIFEQRYREMLTHSLQTHRMFCIGTRLNCDSMHVLPVSTAAVVTSCVQHEDGTSHLVLLGTKRIRLREWVKEEPYRIARVEPIEREPCCEKAVAALRDEAMRRLPPCPAEAALAIGDLCKRLSSTACSEFVCDVLTYHFVRDPEVLNASLMESNLERRYRLLLDSLPDA